MPLSELATNLRIVGEREVRRTLQARRLKKLFVAQDADLGRIKDILKDAEDQGISVEWVEEKIRLGRACAISRGASVAGISSSKAEN